MPTFALLVVTEGGSEQDNTVAAYTFTSDNGTYYTQTLAGGYADNQELNNYVTKVGGINELTVGEVWLELGQSSSSSLNQSPTMVYRPTTNKESPFAEEFSTETTTYTLKQPGAENQDSNTEERPGCCKCM